MKGQTGLLIQRWRRCGDDKHWCDFNTLDIESSKFSGMRGVYVIWAPGDPPEVLRVGQGDIRLRLVIHRRDRRLIAYAKRGPMCVTWTTVNDAHIDGVERYVAEMLNPRFSDGLPDSGVIEVNLPEIF